MTAGHLEADTISHFYFHFIYFVQRTHKVLVARFWSDSSWTDSSTGGGGDIAFWDPQSYLVYLEKNKICLTSARNQLPYLFTKKGVIKLIAVVI
jgi:hypothetical protein